MTMEIRVTAIVAVVAMVAAAPAGADVLTWSADSPFLAGITVAIDFGARLTGITALEAVATGTGGEQRWFVYSGPGGVRSEPYSMFLVCSDGGVHDVGAPTAGTSCWLPLLAPYTNTLAFAPAADWSWLEDGRFLLTVSFACEPSPDPAHIYPEGFTLPLVDHLDVAVSCAQAVAATPTAWGSVQALFRGP